MAIAMLQSIAIICTVSTTMLAFRVAGVDDTRTWGSPSRLPSLSLPSATAQDSDENRPNCQKIRDALCEEFPEIETLFSDAYLESVARVPGRSLDYAIHKNIKGSLEWRRSYRVEDLRRNFKAVSANETCINNAGDATARRARKGRIFIPCVSNDSTCNETGMFRSPKLIEVCASGAFVVLDEELITNELNHDNAIKKNDSNAQRRLVVYSDTSRLNWWKVGVVAGLQYHVLVLEHALDRIRGANHGSTHDSDTKLEESLVICVDTTAPPLLPPPLGALRGMTRLLQSAYPDRIHKIYVGPISPLLRTLYKGLRPFLKPRSRHKITLLGEAPLVFLERLRYSPTS